MSRKKTKSSERVAKSLLGVLATLPPEDQQKVLSYARRQAPPKPRPPEPEIAKTTSETITDLLKKLTEIVSRAPGNPSIRWRIICGDYSITKSRMVVARTSYCCDERYEEDRPFLGLVASVEWLVRTPNKCDPCRAAQAEWDAKTSPFDNEPEARALALEYIMRARGLGRLSENGVLNMLCLGDLYSPPPRLKAIMDRQAEKKAGGAAS